MASPAESAKHRRADSGRATLFFVHEYRSGASRRMESLVAWVKVTQKRRLTVLEIDAELHPTLLEQLGVTSAPALVLVKDRQVVGLLEGRVSGREIDELIGPHLE
jgi:thioredoxin-like negative regulator of GroEL